jgi:hypothetical protein
MINIEGIPIVAARLAQAAQDAKTRRYKQVTARRGASRDLQLDHARATHLPAGYEPKPARHIERT